MMKKPKFWTVLKQKELIIKKCPSNKWFHRYIISNFKKQRITFLYKFFPEYKNIKMNLLCQFCNTNILTPKQSTDSTKKFGVWPAVC